MSLDMGNFNLGEAVDRFSTAIKFAIKALPQESIIKYLASADINLEEILDVSQQMEEYEFCEVILKALQHKQADKSVITRQALALKLATEMN